MVGSSVRKIIVNSGPVVYVGKECRQTMLSAQHVKSGFTGWLSEMEISLGNASIHFDSRLL